MRPAPIVTPSVSDAPATHVAHTMKYLELTLADLSNDADAMYLIGTLSLGDMIFAEQILTDLCRTNIVSIVKEYAVAPTFSF